MTVEPLEQDVPLVSPFGAAPSSAQDGFSFGDAVARAFGDAGDALRRADASERSFAHGRGGLQEMVVERAQADIVFSLAAAAASRATQAVSTLLGMQV